MIPDRQIQNEYINALVRPLLFGNISEARKHWNCFRKTGAVYSLPEAKASLRRDMEKAGVFDVLEELEVSGTEWDEIQEDLREKLGRSKIDAFFKNFYFNLGAHFGFLEPESKIFNYGTCHRYDLNLGLEFNTREKYKYTENTILSNRGEK